MVPRGGTSSNPDSSLLAQWEYYSKHTDLGDEEAAEARDREITEFFETLAEWNEYLEAHVPFIKEANYDL